MPSNEVEFNASAHQYRVGGRVLLSVSQVLKAAGFLSSYATMDPFYANRGTAVHLATEFFDKGTLDFDTLDPRVAPYLEEYREFKRTSGVEVEAIEERFAVVDRGYAGTRDRRVRIGNKRGVVDIKTGSPAPWHPIQTAGYAAPLAEFQGLDIPTAGVSRWCLYLSGKGRYKLVEHTDASDYVVWNAALTVATWKRSRGME